MRWKWNIGLVGLPAKPDFIQFCVLVVIRAGIPERNSGNLTTDHQTQIRLFIPNKPINPREKFYSPVCYIVKNCHKVGRWSRIMKHEEKI